MAHPGPLLRMSVRRAQDSAVLHLSGEADIAGESRLRMRLHHLVADGSAVRHLVVDAAELHFIDVAAMSVLVDAAEALRARGGSLVLRSPTRRVRRLRSVLGVGPLLPVEG